MTLHSHIKAPDTFSQGPAVLAAAAAAGAANLSLSRFWFPSQITQKRQDRETDGNR